MEVKVIGQMDNTIDHTFESANRVYDVGGVSPTINTCGGGGLQPKIIDEPKCLNSKGGRNGIDGLQPSLQDRVYDTNGVSVAVTTSFMPGILEDKTIVAMRGRNPENPSDRTVGTPTEQRLEPNSQGICNTLTSVQKDNLVMEVKQLGFMDNGTGQHQSNTVYDENALCPNITTIEGGGTQQIKVMTETVHIKQATSQGYIECEVGGVADLSFPDSKTRRGRVQEKGQVSPTLIAGEQDICRIETYSPYVNQKYKEFQDENGYIPEYFNPYNKTELTDVAPTLTAQGESVTKSSTVLKCESQYRIRKLTPRECWRLMDFKDEDFIRASEVNSRTQLYKQAGNSIVKNVLVAILGQMIPSKEDVYKKLETR